MKREKYTHTDKFCMLLVQVGCLPATRRHVILHKHKKGCPILHKCSLQNCLVFRYLMATLVNCLP